MIPKSFSCFVLPIFVPLTVMWKSQIRVDGLMQLFGKLSLSYITEVKKNPSRPPPPLKMLPLNTFSKHNFLSAAAAILFLMDSSQKLIRSSKILRE